MLTRTEYLLTKLAEECAEVAHCCSKAIIFGLEETQEGQDLNNAERLKNEYADLMGTYDMLVYEKKLVQPTWEETGKKSLKIEQYMKLSRERGIIK